MSTSSRPRSSSRTRQPPSRPTTPLRPSSRSSLQSHHSASRDNPHISPLNDLEPAFAELADSMADLEANFMHLQLMHESLSRFGESFASFLYGLNMNAFCVDFPEAPVEESWKRERMRAEREGAAESGGRGVSAGGFEGEQSFMTAETSYVDQASSTRSGSRYTTPGPKTPSKTPSKRGQSGIGRGGPTGRGRAATRGTRPSGLARAKPRGAR